jgi:hypothetical protein
MTFIPPYTNTFRTIYLDFSAGTGITTGTIHVPFDVDEVIFRGVMATYPATDVSIYSTYACDPLTHGGGAPIGFSHYTGIVDTYQSSTNCVISYMYPTSRYFQGQYTFTQLDPFSSTGSTSTFAGDVSLIIEFRKYN